MPDIFGAGATARPALIYFRQVEGDDVPLGRKMFPAQPDDAQQLVFTQMEVYGPNDPYTIVDSKNYPLNKGYELENVVDAINLANNATQIYSVHPKAMLLRMYHWALMKQFTARDFGATYQHVASRTIDICETFHLPAILPYEERRAFGTKDIERWLDFHPGEDDPDPETTLLQMFCARCV